MTACIAGWAHTPFGRLDAETVESLVVRAADAALQDAGIAAADVDEILLGHFNAGFSAQDFTASLAVLQASPDLRFKQATRVENACATGSRGGSIRVLKSIEGEGGAHRAGGRRRANDDDSGTRDRPEPAQGVLRARRSRHRRPGFAGIFRQHRGALFPEIRRSVRRAGADRGQESQERRRQSLRADPQGPGLRLLPHREREEPICRRSAQAHRLLAGLRWGGRSRARRCRRRRARRCARRWPSAPPRT